jgi:hypothetical protein
MASLSAAMAGHTKPREVDLRCYIYCIVVAHDKQASAGGHTYKRKGPPFLLPLPQGLLSRHTLDTIIESPLKPRPLVQSLLVLVKFLTPRSRTPQTEKKGTENNVIFLDDLGPLVVCLTKMMYRGEATA